MKSPKKRSWKALIAFVILGVPVSIAMGLIFRLTIPSTFSWPPTVACIVISMIMFTLSGLSMSLATTTILNRKVDHPVDPWHIEYGKTYWLNGETKSQYVGTDKYTGRLCFDIFGIGNYTTSTKDSLSFLPGEVGEYFSTEQEVFPIKKK